MVDDFRMTDVTLPLGEVISTLYVAFPPYHARQSMTVPSSLVILYDMMSQYFFPKGVSIVSLPTFSMG